MASETEIMRLQKEVSLLKSKLQSFEEGNAASALVSLYASRMTRELGIKESLKIFNNDSFHSPIFCHGHLPVVLAHFIRGVDTLPNGLNAMPSMITVRETLLHSFKKIVDCEIPITQEQIKHFREVLEEIEEAHMELDLLQTMAAGILELKDHISRHRVALLQLKKSSSRWVNINLKDEDVLPYEEIADIQEPLDFVNRCMIRYNFLSRMLLNLDNESTDSKKVGMVDLEINLERVVRNAADEAKDICVNHYGSCPDTNFILSTDSKTVKFPFMSTTIRYIVMELLKNAFRATVEAHMKKNSAGIVDCDDMPPVEILINLQEGTQHACICISDEGLGMTQKGLEMAMAYSYTSVSEPALKLNTEGTLSVTEAPSPLAGYGYGLPMSKVYAQSFGGDLQVRTMEGYGTRAYYYIKLA